jgi:hypothetical protein
LFPLKVHILRFTSTPLGVGVLILIHCSALNTLDMLKKGTSQLAQRARAASRVLEAQVGTNPRILVQRDEDFVLWDTLEFSPSTPAANVVADPQISQAQLTNPSSAPEWVRRTVCCSRFEADKATADKKKVVLAVSSALPLSTSPSRNFNAATPVPLPAPQPQTKFEPRSSGGLVGTWARRVGVTVLDVRPGPGGSDDESDRSMRKRPMGGVNNGGRGGGHVGGGLVERPPAVKAMMEMVSQPNSGRVLRVLARGEKLEPE